LLKGRMVPYLVEAAASLTGALFALVGTGRKQRTQSDFA
jgi:hypothetical protein